MEQTTKETVKEMARRSVTSSQVNTVCLIILASVAVAYTLIFTRSVAIPFVISVLIYTVMAPFLRYATKKTKLPRLLVLGVTFLLITTVLTFVVIFISNSIGSFISGIDAYKEKLLSLTNWVTQLMATYDIHVNSASIMETLANLPVFNFVKGVGGTLLSLTVKTFLVIIILLFFFVGNNSSSEKEAEQPKEAHKSAQEIQSKISFYITAKTIVSLGTGIVVWIILAAFKVEMAFMFGVITFLLNYIPNVGSIVAVMLPIPVIFLQYGLGPKFVVIMSLCIATQFIIGNILEPKIMGSGTDMHPVTVICVLVFWSLIWGVAGAFLAVPMTAAIQVVMSKFELTKPIAELMAGRMPS
ncbi:AI-2 transport protein TqsA [Elusimicrobium simillimum]|uniref:AI-2E family transporter n=1 Tax=Elusimicrobium simillimum TaxID=3143438 RepID=UPI003C6F27A9